MEAHPVRDRSVSPFLDVAVDPNALAAEKAGSHTAVQVVP
jgi:hypothetical protein